MNTYSITYTVRQSLSGHALATALMDWGFHEREMPDRSYFRSLYQTVVEAARHGDMSSLTRDTMMFFAEGRLKSFDVDISNSQLSGGGRYLERFQFGYEPDILAMLARFMPKDGIFFDGGSNWGYFGLHLLLDTKFSGTVVAFEPVAQSFRDLKRLAGLLGFLPRIRCLPLALGEVRGELPISSNIMSGSQSLADAVDYGEMVRVERLDDLGLPAPSLIKLDVEDYEASVLRGARRIIDAHRPPVIFESWLREDFQRTLAPFWELERLGYKFFNPEFAVETPIDFRLPCDVSGTLKLTPILPQDRRELQDRINVLAVHEAYEM